jgi:hypothetical protein
MISAPVFCVKEEVECKQAKEAAEYKQEDEDAEMALDGAPLLPTRAPASPPPTKGLPPTALFSPGPPVLPAPILPPLPTLFGEGFGKSGGSPPARECFDLFACHDGCGCEDFGLCHTGCSDDELNDFDCGESCN